MNSLFKPLGAFLVALSCITLLTACSQEASNSLASLPKVKLDQALMTSYQQTCAQCHEMKATGAPLTGDTLHWQVVLNKPFDLVVDRVINGFGGMPPLGQCFQCSQEELEKLIHYMSRPAI